MMQFRTNHRIVFALVLALMIFGMTFEASARQSTFIESVNAPPTAQGKGKRPPPPATIAAGDYTPRGYEQANNMPFPIPDGFQDHSHDEGSLEEGHIAAQPTYTMAQLNAMSYSQLVSTIRSIQWSDIVDLWTWNSSVYTFYNSDARIQALLDGLQASGQSFTASNDQGIDTLIEVIRAGFYHGFYHSELSRINTWSYKTRCWPAMSAIASNPNFTWGTSTQSDVITALGNMFSSGIASPQLINQVTPVIKRFNDNPAWMSDTGSLGSGRRSAVYALGNGIHYALFWAAATPYPNPGTSPFYNQINGLIEEFGRTGLYGTMNKEYNWLLNNAAYWVGGLGSKYVSGSRPNQILTQMIALYRKWPMPSVTAVKAILDYYGGVDANGVRYTLDQVKAEVRAIALPARYTFDNNTMIVQAGRQVDPVKIRRLYWAVKEVKAQFHRMIGSDQPLEPNNPDNILTAVIYNTPTEYEYNYFLNDLSTANGGLYIESQGTFYTYERTPADSIYTLEDLFRHELTHYLQGRFLVPGMWGTGPIYQNERLTWFEEGHAEFMAGSSRTLGVRSRKSISQNLVPGTMTLAQVLSAQYNSGFTFYNYSFAFWDYMYRYRQDIILRLIGHIKANDVAGYDSYISTLKSDSALAQAYQNHLTYLRNNAGSFIDPVTSDDYLATITDRPTTAVYADIVSASGISNTSSQVLSSASHRLFELRGTYTGTTSAGQVADSQAMGRAADGFLNTLAGNSWNGFKTLTAHFVNYRKDSANRYQYDLVFSGELRPDGIIPTATPATSTPRPTNTTTLPTSTVRPTNTTTLPTSTVRPTNTAIPSTPIPSIIFDDTFESNKGWATNPNGSDTATLGQWERGIPEPTDYQGPKQIAAFSASSDLVTGRLAGSSAGAYDLDGGTSSIQSPLITLPAGQTLALAFQYYLAHSTNAGSDDYLRVSVVEEMPSGGKRSTVVLEQRGAASNLDAAWRNATANLSPFAGQQVRILIEAADAGTASLLEAAVDNVRISGSGSVTPTPLTATPVTPTTIPPTATPGTGEEQVVNGGFEQGTSPWTIVAPYNIISNSKPHSGVYGVYMGGGNNTDITFEQTITVPSNGALSYWWQNVTQESGPGDTLAAQLYDTNGSLIATLRTTNSSSPQHTWIQEQVSLSAYAGRQVRLRFQFRTNASLPSWVYIDDISVR